MTLTYTPFLPYVSNISFCFKVKLYKLHGKVINEFGGQGNVTVEMTGSKHFYIINQNLQLSTVLEFVTCVIGSLCHYTSCETDMRNLFSG